MEDGQFDGSRLGTKEYWDKFYEMELANFEDNGDEGEIWFGRSAEARILKFLMDSSRNHALSPSSTRICDLGTGNGSLLRKLRSRGFTRLTGVDYSERAVRLAKAQSESEGEEAEFPIEFRVADLTADSLEPELRQRFDVLLDKGTLDAISLSNMEDRKTTLERYRKNLCAMFTPLTEQSPNKKQYFIIVSCNFTKDELISMLAALGNNDGIEEGSLRYLADLPGAPPSIQFGGRSGQTTSGLIFQWRQRSKNE